MIWRDWQKLIADARLAHKRNPSAVTELALLNSIQDALNDNVGRKDGLIWQRNPSLGTGPYNAMAQADMGFELVTCGLLLNSMATLNDAFAVLDVITTAKGRGGLRWTRPDGWWFHSATEQKYGLTLNQHLFACRDLARAAELLAPGFGVQAARYRAAAQKGIDQLAGTSFPNWGDYKPKIATRTWAFYGHGGKDGKGYFLKAPGANPKKNGGYHTKVMELVATLAGMGLMVPSNGLPWFYKMYQLKQSERLFVDSVPSSGGNFSALAGVDNVLSPFAVDFFEAL